MKRWLLFLVPDKQGTLLAAALSLVAFLLGLLDMMSRDFNGARSHLYMSLGIMATLFLLKYLGMRATYQVAEEARVNLERHLRQAKLPRKRPTERAEARQAAQERAQEQAQMKELTSALRQALHNIDPDSPVRPKYEATLELMERIAHKGS